MRNVCARMPLFGGKDKPILAVDIDGVISLFGFEGRKPTRSGRAAAGRVPPDRRDAPLHLDRRPGQRLNRLAETYELVWASGWEDRANDHLPQILGVPEAPLPHLRRPTPASAPPTGSSARSRSTRRGRPLAWIDDSFDHSCYEWGEKREAPTLLVPTEPDRGLEEAQVEALEAWVRDGFEPPR